MASGATSRRTPANPGPEWAGRAEAMPPTEPAVVRAAMAVFRTAASLTLPFIRTPLILVVRAATAGRLGFPFVIRLVRLASPASLIRTVPA